MKNLNSRLCVGSLVLMLALSSVGFCQDAYWGINGGLGMLDDSDGKSSDGDFSLDYDDGWILGGVLGWDFGAYRLEGELAYQTNDLDSFKPDGGASESASEEFESLSLFFNAYYDIEMDSAWTPYVGGGLGAAQAEISDVEDTVFAWHLDAGINYAVSETVSLDLSYRYLCLDDVEDSGDSIEYASNNILFGVRIMFQ
jgi:OOP family OmpA-OmpF porin